MPQTFEELERTIREAEKGVRDSLPIIASVLRTATLNQKIMYNSEVRNALSHLKRELNSWDRRKEKWKR